MEPETRSSKEDGSLQSGAPCQVPCFFDGERSGRSLSCTDLGVQIQLRASTHYGRGVISGGNLTEALYSWYRILPLVGVI